AAGKAAVPPIPNAAKPAVPPIPGMATAPVPPIPGMPAGQVPPIPAKAAAAPGAAGPLAKPGAKVPPPPRPAQSGLLGEVDDAAVDKIFDKLGIKDNPNAPTAKPVPPQTGAPPAAPPMPKVNVRDAVNTVRNVAMETGQIQKPPRIDGISRLSAAPEEQDAGQGKINSIGKFLLDQQDQQQLGKLTQQDITEGKVKVLTLEAADEIYKLLNHIATLPGVLGSCIVGHDGLPIANNLSQEYDPESIGALALGIYVNTTNTIRKMNHNHLHQLVARTQVGFLIIADFGGGILVTASNAQATEQLIPLMRSITQLVAQ
ncbi:MAG: roadblock/LC7 domain-containing protein, partial [Candidatus Obscuribacterales bacterium]|nr:roadblock/LC7 domain-containing protein [Candidatus Obscuribacterales bacterium]